MECVLNPMENQRLCFETTSFSFLFVPYPWRSRGNSMAGPYRCFLSLSEVSNPTLKPEVGNMCTSVHTTTAVSYVHYISSCQQRLPSLPNTDNGAQCRADSGPIADS